MFSDPPCICRTDASALYGSQIGYEVLKAQIFLPAAEQLAAWQADPAFLALVADAFCGDMTVQISGDAKDSGGCVDPSFWSIHPHVERLYQFRILKGPGFSSDPSQMWPGTRSCFGARSNDFDPDHLCYQSAASDDPVSGRPTVGDDATCCGGHHVDSRIFASYPNAVPPEDFAVAAAAAAVGREPGRRGPRGG